jgi:acyl carrier protein
MGAVKSDSLSSVAPTEAAIRNWCIEYLAKSLKISAEKIDIDAKFARLGVDSANSVFFLMDLEEWLSVELPAETVFEHPSIAKLARYLVTCLSDESARGRRRG